MSGEEKISDLYLADHGKALLKVAREAISQRLGIEISNGCNNDAENALKDPVFERKRATFVTLKLAKQLRGCIGSLIAIDSILNDIKQNAINAAFYDHRFSPLSKEELKNVEIEVSILSEPKQLSYSGKDDLLKKIRPGIDGVILKKGTLRSTFLPQVWEQLPVADDFFSHLCIKAGLHSETWKTEELEIFTYQVQHFSE